MHHRRPLLWSFLCLLAALWLPLALQLTAAGSCILWAARVHGRTRGVALLCLAGCLAAAALASFQTRSGLLLSAAPAAAARHYLDQPVLAEAVILERPLVTAEQWQASLRLRRVERGALQRPVRDAVLLFGEGPAPEWREGDLVRAWMILSRPRPDRNGSAPLPPPRRLNGRLKSLLLVQAHHPGSRSAQRLVATLRAAARTRLEAALADADAETRALALALGLGVRETMPAALQRDFRRSGLGHVLAVSGLHLAALATGMAWLARRAGLGRRGASRAVVLSLVLFLVLLPGRPSVLRAVAMGLAPVLARLSGRRADPLNALGGAGLLLLICRPQWSLDAGFLLSFSVTAAVLIHAGETAGWIRGLLRITWAASAASLPLTGWAFGGAATIGLLANPLAVPLSGLLVMLCLVTTALSLAHPLAAAPAAAALSLGLGLLQRLAQAAAAVPGGYLAVPRGRTVLTATALLLLMLRPAGRLARRGRLAGLALLHALLLAGAIPPAALPDGRLALRTLDVGQGDALLVRLPGGDALLIDGGGRPGLDDDVGRRLVIPALVDAGIRRLRAVALSHPHHDHGDGLRAVLEEMPVGELWLPRLDGLDALTMALCARALERGIAVRVPHPGEVRTWSGARIRCLGPDLAGRRSDPNRASMVLLIETDEGSILLPGDLDGAGEQSLLGAGQVVPATLLKVAHHGSRTSTSSAWLRAVSPQAAVISVGSSNPWGHPHLEVIQRLQQAGVPVYRTDMSGPITVVMERSRPRVTTRPPGSP